MQDGEFVRFNPTSETRLDYIGSPHEMPDIVMAFTRGVRQEIGVRDNWTCVESGRKASKGWLLDASHYDHDRNNPDYNNPDNGRMLCLACHLKEHADMFINDPTNENMYALKLIARRSWQGLRTIKHYRKYPTNLTYDQQEVIGILKSRGLDPDLILS